MTPPASAAADDGHHPAIGACAEDADADQVASATAVFSAIGMNCSIPTRAGAL